MEMLRFEIQYVSKLPASRNSWEKNREVFKRQNRKRGSFSSLKYRVDPFPYKIDAFNLGRGI